MGEGNESNVHSLAKAAAKRRRSAGASDDGDVAYLVGLSGTGQSVEKDFDPEIEHRVKSLFNLGPPYEAGLLEAIPRALIISVIGSKGIPDIFGWNIGPYVMSNRMRNLLDRLEPGVHNYIQLAVKSIKKIAGKTDHGTYHLLVPPPVVDCVEIEGTEFWSGGNGYAAYDAGHRALSPTKSDPCNLRGSTIEGRHLWRAPREFTRSYICSSALWREMQQEKMTGWMARKACTIVQPSK